MEKERWERVERLFQAARELPPGARADFIVSGCGGDESLRREVETLLASFDGSEEFLARPALGSGFHLAAPGPAQDPDAANIGRRIGAYRLERLLGSGGMGTVYLARREDEAFDKRVAVKLVRAGMDTSLVVRRFRTERQALARLEHEHIARLLDGGTTDDGRPYLVMEFVDGAPIDAYCDARCLNVRQRLKLFCDVCDAVQYAHSQLIVHRDIKSGNILITPDGKPKLLDFGIAKILHSRQELATRTVTSERFLTPESASPEQILGRPITTSSDVYSLGVVLYVLLSGHHPHRVRGGTPLEIDRAICRDEPTKPSLAVRRENTHRSRRIDPATVSAARATTPERLRRMLRGDLDTIVMKAVRKEPDQRYGSARQLSEDIRRFLDGRPVEARRPTLRYRADKFVRRNSSLTLVAALLVVSIAAGVAGVVREARHARRESEVSERVLTCLNSLFGDFDPTRGSDVTVRDILDRGSERVFRELADLPEAQARVAEQIAETYAGLGVDDANARWRERVVTVRRALPSGDDRAFAASLHELGQALIASDPERAERLLREALQMRRRIPDGDEELAGSLRAIGGVLWVQGRMDEAEPFFREALAARRALHSGPHPSVVHSERSLAHFLLDSGRYVEAEAHAREALRVAQVLSDPELIPRAREGLCGILQDRGRYREAEELQRVALEEFRLRYGEDHSRVNTAKLNLALLLKDDGRYVEAEAIGREALRSARRDPVGNDLRVGHAWFALAKILADKGDLKDAEQAARNALELATNPTDSARRLTLLARSLLELGRPAEAEPLARESWKRHEEIFGAQSWKTANTASLLGASLSDLGRLEEAEPLLLESYVRIRDDRGPEHRRTQQALERLVTLYERDGQAAEAERYRSMRTEPQVVIE